VDHAQQINKRAKTSRVSTRYKVRNCVNMKVDGGIANLVIVRTMKYTVTFTVIENGDTCPSRNKTRTNERDIANSTLNCAVPCNLDLTGSTDTTLMYGSPLGDPTFVSAMLGSGLECSSFHSMRPCPHPPHARSGIQAHQSMRRAESASLHL